MTAARYDIVVTQGATFARIMDFADALGNPIAQTGNTYIAAIKQTPADTTAVLTFTVAIDAVITNRIRVSATATQTAAIPATTNAVCLWDLQSTAPDGTKTALLQGNADIIQRIAP